MKDYVGTHLSVVQMVDTNLMHLVWHLQTGAIVIEVEYIHSELVMVHSWYGILVVSDLALD